MKWNILLLSMGEQLTYPKRHRQPFRGTILFLDLTGLFAYPVESQTVIFCQIEHALLFSIDFNALFDCFHSIYINLVPT